MLGDFNSVGPNDVPNTTVLTIGNNYDPEKMEIKITKEGDPYGFWTVSFSQGLPPKELRGKYTSYDFAKGAVDKYIANHRQERSITKTVEKKSK